MSGQKIYGQYYTKEESDAQDLLQTVGLVTNPVVTVEVDHSLTVAPVTCIVYNNSTYDQHPEQYIVSGGNFLPAPYTTGAVVVDYNGGSPVMRMTYSEGEINQSDVTPVLTFVRNDEISYLAWGDLGKAASDQMVLRLIRTCRFFRERGFALSTVGTRDNPTPGLGATIRTEEGVMWHATVWNDLDATFPVKGDDLLGWPHGRPNFYWHTGGVWTESHFTPCLLSEYITPGKTPVKIGTSLSATVMTLATALAAGVNPSIAPDGASFTLDGVTHYQFKGVAATWHEVAHGVHAPEFANNAATVLHAAPEKVQPVDGQMDGPFTWKNTPASPFDIQIGVTVDASIENLRIFLAAMPDVGIPADGTQVTICNVKIEVNSDLTPGYYRINIGSNLTVTLANLVTAMTVGGNAIPSIPVGGICSVPIQFWTGTTSPQYDNLHYDNGTDIVAATAGHFVINWVWKFIQNDSNAIGIVLGTDDYASLADAQAAQTPGDIPSHIVGLGYLVGRIIVEKGSDGSAVVVENTSTTAFVGGVVSDHNSLSNLFGGVWHVPNQGRSDATAGTNGTPSAVNPFVTNSDPRNSDPRPTIQVLSTFNNSLAYPVNPLVGDRYIALTTTTHGGITWTAQHIYECSVFHSWVGAFDIPPFEGSRATMTTPNSDPVGPIGLPISPNILYTKGKWEAVTFQALRAENLGLDIPNYTGATIPTGTVVTLALIDSTSVVPDVAASLSMWLLTGVVSSNSDNLWLHGNLVDDGSGFFHVDLYKDVARSFFLAGTPSMVPDDVTMSNLVGITIPSINGKVLMRSAPTAGTFDVVIPVYGGVKVAPAGSDAGLGIAAFDIPNNTLGLVMFLGGTFADRTLNLNERVPLKVLVDAGIDIRIGDRLVLSSVTDGVCEIDPPGTGQGVGRATECVIGGASPVLCAINRTFINMDGAI